MLLPLEQWNFWATTMAWGCQKPVWVSYCSCQNETWGWCCSWMVSGDRRETFTAKDWCQVCPEVGSTCGEIRQLRYTWAWRCWIFLGLISAQLILVGADGDINLPLQTLGCVEHEKIFLSNRASKDGGGQFASHFRFVFQPSTGPGLSFSEALCILKANCYIIWVYVYRYEKYVYKYCSWEKHMT